MADPLAALLGLQAQGGGGQDALTLAALRGRRRDELKPRVIAGDPRASRLFEDVTHDMAMDPDTGLEQQEQVADTTEALQSAALFNRPEIAGPRRELQEFELQKEILPAQINARAQAEARAQQFFNQLALNQQSQEAISERSRETQAGIANRMAGTQQATSNRAMLNAALRRRDQHMKAEPAARGWGIMDMLTGSNERRDEELAGIEAEIQRFSGPQGVSEADRAALHLLETGKSLDQAIADGTIDGAELLPEDIEAIQNAMARWSAQ